MVKVGGQNSNRNTVKETAENGPRILGYDDAAYIASLVPGVKNSRLPILFEAHSSTPTCGSDYDRQTSDHVVVGLTAGEGTRVHPAVANQRFVVHIPEPLRRHKVAGSPPHAEKCTPSLAVLVAGSLLIPPAKTTPPTQIWIEIKICCTRGFLFGEGVTIFFFFQYWTEDHIDRSVSSFVESVAFIRRARAFR